MSIVCRGLGRPALLLASFGLGLYAFSQPPQVLGPPPCRVLSVAFEGRELLLRPEDRALFLPSEPRSLLVFPDDRIGVPAESRTLYWVARGGTFSVLAESREVPVPAEMRELSVRDDRELFVAAESRLLSVSFEDRTVRSGC